MPDAWETAHAFDKKLAADAAQDEDGDGLTNLEEYLTGTDPQDAASYLRVEADPGGSGLVRLTFNAVAGRAYTLQTRLAFDGSVWTDVISFAAQAGDRIEQVLDDTTAGVKRFYRLKTP